MDEEAGKHDDDDDDDVYYYIRWRLMKAEVPMATDDDVWPLRDSHVTAEVLMATPCDGF